MCPMCEAMSGPWGWVMILLMAVFWITLFGLLAWLVYRLVRRRSGSEGAAASRDGEAEAILRERYARGDIDHAKFERMQGDLRRGGPA